MDYSRFVNDLSSRRRPAITREMTRMLSTAGPEMIPLSTGMPNPDMFPFANIAVTLSDGTQISIEGPALKKGLNYIPTNGLAELVAKMKSLQKRVHALSEDAFDHRYDVVMTNGSQDGICKAMEMLMNVGDAVILEEFVYSTILSILEPYQPNYVVIEADDEGMRSDSLAGTLQSRYGSPEQMKKDPKAPRFIYVNPSGANPTGTVMSKARKEEIYAVCRKYDLLILEDDPYYFMQFGDPEKRESSLLSMDADCRVLRFDSFSKILSSGIRLGFATGPKPLMDRIALHMQVSVVHASSLSQVLADALLSRWGDAGLDAHLAAVADFYRRRRDAALAAADRHLRGLCRWSVPRGGMFLWIEAVGVANTWPLIMEKAMSKNIMLIPGRAFSPRSSDGKPCAFMRASFSLAKEKDFDLAFERLAELIRDELQQK